MIGIPTGWARPSRLCILAIACGGLLRSATPRDYAWKTLKQAAQQKSGDRRAQAIAALGVMRGDGEGIRIVENALKDTDGKVRNAAIRSLGEMGAKSAIPKIKTLLGSADAGTVVTIAAVLKELNDPEGYEIYYEILTGRRKGSGGLLAGIKDKSSLEKMGLEEALGFVPYASIGLSAYDYIKTNGSSSAAAAAATQLALDPDPAVRKALVQAAFDGKEAVKVAALRALAQRGDRAVVSDIAHLMYADNALVCYTAAAAVVRLTDGRTHTVQHS